MFRHIVKNGPQHYRNWNGPHGEGKYHIGKCGSEYGSKREYEPYYAASYNSCCKTSLIVFKTLHNFVFAFVVCTLFLKSAAKVRQFSDMAKYLSHFNTILTFNPLILYPKAYKQIFTPFNYIRTHIKEKNKKTLEIICIFQKVYYIKLHWVPNRTRDAQSSF